MEKGASSWLSALPIKAIGYAPNKQEFTDASHMSEIWMEGVSRKCYPRTKTSPGFIQLTTPARINICSATSDASLFCKNKQVKKQAQHAFGKKIQQNKKSAGKPNRKTGRHIRKNKPKMSIFSQKKTPKLPLARLTIRPVLGETVPLFNILSRRPDRSAKRPALAFSQHNTRTLPISMFSLLLLLCSVPVAYLLTVNACFCLFRCFR